MRFRTIPIREATVGVVLRNVLRACLWPALALVFSFAACTVVGDPVLLQLSMWMLLHALCLFAGFVVHEMFHVVGIKLTPGVSHVILASSPLRMSVVPLGSLYGWQAALIALLGPVAACLVGVPLALAVPDFLLQYWFFLHGTFLLPPFGDGRSLIVGVRMWRLRVPLQHPLELGPAPAARDVPDYRSHSS